MRSRLVWPPGVTLAAATTALLACAHGDSATRPKLPTSNADCPRGTRWVDASISDQGWSYPERTVGCEREAGKFDGLVFEFYEGAPGKGAVELVGRYTKGVAAGPWREYDERSGRLLGAFRLDPEGSGTFELRDQVGHVLRGPLTKGQRDGAWVFFDADGKNVATERYANGKFVGRQGKVPWDPPMIDEADKCPTEPEDRDKAAEADGCPEPSPGH